MTLDPQVERLGIICRWQQCKKNGLVGGFRSRQVCPQRRHWKSSPLPSHLSFTLSKRPLPHSPLPLLLHCLHTHKPQGNSATNHRLKPLKLWAKIHLSSVYVDRSSSCICWFLSCLSFLTHFLFLGGWKTSEETYSEQQVVLRALPWEVVNKCSLLQCQLPLLTVTSSIAPTRILGMKSPPVFCPNTLGTEC